MKVTRVTTMTRKEMDILLWKWKWLPELGTGNSCKLKVKVTHVTTMTRKEMDILLWEWKWLL